MSMSSFISSLLKLRPRVSSLLVGLCHICVKSVELCIKVALLQSWLIWDRWRLISWKAKLLLTLKISICTEYFAALFVLDRTCWWVDIAVKHIFTVFSLWSDWGKESLCGSNSIVRAKFSLDGERWWVIEKSTAIRERRQAKVIALDKLGDAHLSLCQFCIAGVSSYLELRQ